MLRYINLCELYLIIALPSRVTQYSALLTPSKCEIRDNSKLAVYEAYRLVLAVRLVPAEVVRGRKLCRSVGTSRTSGKKASSFDDAIRRG